MRGLAFELLERVVDPDAWDVALEHSGLAGVFTVAGRYPDDEFWTLLDLARTADPDPSDRLTWFATEAVGALLEVRPGLLSGVDGTYAALRRLHREALDEYLRYEHGVTLPTLTFHQDAASPQLLGVDVRGSQWVCALLDGALRGLAAHFGHPIAVHHLKCVRRRDSSCFVMATTAGGS